MKGNAEEKAQARATLRMETAIHNAAWKVLLRHENPHMLELLDSFENLARKLGSMEPDRKILKIAFLRAFFCASWQRLEAHYGRYADVYAFEQRLDAWVEAFEDIARPLKLHELFLAHMRDNPKMPLISDINRQLQSSDRLRKPRCVPELPEPLEKPEPGPGRIAFEEWRQAMKNKKLREASGTGA